MATAGRSLRTATRRTPTASRWSGPPSGSRRPGQDGGGIYSTARLTITDSTISGNNAGDEGGGIAASEDGTEGGTTITGATISGNEARYGGGIQISGGAELFLTNTTISGNLARDYSGAISNFGGALAVLASVTVTDNHADSDGDLTGGTGGLGGDFTIRNTIVSGNVDPFGDPDCNGDITSEPANHLGIQSVNCNVTGETTFNTTGDAMLGPLAWNGGHTDTHALLPGSPAIDTGAEGGCTSATGGALTQDQRGGARTVGPKCDMGAYEAGAVPPATPTPTPEPTLPPTPTATPTATPVPPATELTCAGPAKVSDGVGVITATLTSAGMPLAGQEIAWSDLPGLFTVFELTSVTDELGVAETNYPVPADAGVKGDETVTAAFMGKGFAPATCDWTFHVVSSAFPPPTPSPTAAPGLQGDTDCDGDVDSVDGLFVLRDVAGFDPSECIDQGDVDCDEDRDSVDALGILRDVAALPPLDQNEPCTDIGTPV